MNKIKGLKFQPWVGQDYGKSEYGRLLLVGESHYLNNDKATSNLTTLVVRNHLKDSMIPPFYMISPFFRKAGHIFDSINCHSLWKKVAFANLIQTGLKDSTQQPTVAEKNSVNESFRLLLDDLKPEKVIVLSKRMWTKWMTGGICHQVTAINAANKRSEVWEYEYNTGKCIVIGISHPSSPGFSSKSYTPLLNKFLQMKSITTF